MENYFKAVFEDSMAAQNSFSDLEHDFWKYNLRRTAGSYWTGYYSTYPEIKRDIMAFSDYVQAVTQLYSLVDLGESEHKVLKSQTELLETMSLMLHHDAITGTHKIAVG